MRHQGEGDRVRRLPLRRDAREEHEGEQGRVQFNACAVYGINYGHREEEAKMPHAARGEDKQSQGIGQVAADCGCEGEQGRVQFGDRAVVHGINYGR